MLRLWRISTRIRVPRGRRGLCASAAVLACVTGNERPYDGTKLLCNEERRKEEELAIACGGMRTRRDSYLCRERYHPDSSRDRVERCSWDSFESPIRV